MQNTQKLLLVIALCIVCVSAFQLKPKLPREDKRQAERGTCFIVDCATEGQSCSPQNSNPPTYPICIDSYCDYTKSQCIALLPNGTECDSDIQCVSQYCSREGICDSPYDYNLANGEACEDDYQCASFNCSNKVCSGNDHYGVCRNDAECDMPYYCKLDNNGNGYCTTRIAEGGACDPEYSQDGGCAFGFFCALSGSQNTGICTSIFSPQIGDSCYESADCPDGAYCDRTKQGWNGVCAVVNPPSFSPCNQDQDCKSNEYCTCVYTKGEQECVTSDYGNADGSRAYLTVAYKCYVAKCNGVLDENCVSECVQYFCPYIIGEVTLYESYIRDMYPECALAHIFDGIDLFQGILEPCANYTKSA